jgi:FtsP/CotA-like multicopper oxidase with cupredoxin domain
MTDNHHPGGNVSRPVRPRLPRRAVSRRLLVQTAASAAATAAVFPALSRSASASARLAPVPFGVREFILMAEQLDWERMPGMTTPAWGYNGQTPGPELRVREGDLVRVVLRNALPVPTTIHWHGVHLTPEMDGPAGLNQAAVEPGEQFLYEFLATPAGTRWYHSHADPALQVPMGLYGPLIIEPATPPRPYAYDREYTLILGEWDSELTPEVAAGTSQRGPRDRTLRGGELGSDMFLVNGKAHGGIPPLVVSEGDRVLLRLINAGHMPHPIHIHGHSFRIVATDGNPVPEGMEWTKDTVLVGPAERYDLELDAVNPGVWMVHCHIEHHMANGMMTVLQYEGHTPTGPAGEFFDLATGESAPHNTHGGEHQPHLESHTGDLPIDPGATVTMVDDRFEPTLLTVESGTTVSWVNGGAHWHSIAAYDGSFESGKIAPGDAFSHRFDDPGTYQYICKHHGLQGMIGQIDVTG